MRFIGAHRHSMLQLNDSLIIGKGSERWCYQHPKNPNLCIKVAVHLPKPGRKPQSEREASYFGLLKRRSIPFTHLPDYLGTEETSLGLGYVFELIRSEDGSVAARLEDLFHELPATTLREMMLELQTYMLRYGVVPCDMSVRNMLVQTHQGQTRLMLVDGVGNRDFIPLASYCLPFARLKIARIWRKFSTKLNLDLTKT